MIQPTFNVKVGDFDRRMAEFIHYSGKTVVEAVRQQARLLCKEIIQRTPPFSGRDVQRMLAAQGKELGWRDWMIENMSDRMVGERRVEKDIKKIIFGVTSEEGRQLKKKRGGAAGNVERVEGRLAVRVFAKKDGTVYGVDQAEYRPNANMDDLKRVHYMQRTKRGRVTSAGQKTRDIGRWKFLNMLVVRDNVLARYIRLKKKMVGEAKGGWVAAMWQLGSRSPSKNGWMGRHSKSGGYVDKLSVPDKPSFTLINRSRWAQAGDPDRIIRKSLEGRARAMAGWIKKAVDREWKQRFKKAA